MRTNKHLFALAVVSMSLAASPLIAQGRGRGNGDDKHKTHDLRGNHVVVVHSNGDVSRIPPGLAKKPGGMPPGQYRKLYRPVDGVAVMRDVFSRRGYTVIRTAPYGESQFVYYRTPDGMLRKAVVSPGPERLTFVNVPPTLLQLIMARLY